MVIPLHRIRFSWASTTHIDIEWAKGTGDLLEDFAPLPSVTLCEREIAMDEYAVRGVPAICWRDDTPVLFECLQLRENTDYFIDVTLPMPKAEAARKSLQKPTWPFSERLRAVFKPDPPKRWREPNPSSVVISGQLHLRNHAGILDLSTENGAVLRAEVVCRKISYLAEFQVLLNEVAEFLTELLLQYDSPVSAAFDLTDARTANLAAVLFQMRYVMAEDNLPLAVEEMLSQVHATLATETSMRGITEVEEPSVEVLVNSLEVSLFEAGGPLARTVPRLHAAGDARGRGHRDHRHARKPLREAFSRGGRPAGAVAYDQSQGAGKSRGGARGGGLGSPSAGATRA